MSVIILTKPPKLSPFSLQTYKKFFKKDRGPQGVTSSVIRGLKMLNKDYLVNPKEDKIAAADTLWVNESIEALKWAIEYKKKYEKTKHLKLVVGPNLVVIPDEHDGIIYNDAIDIILQPSQWTRDFYLKYNPSLESKIKIWPTGVHDPFEKNPLPEKKDYLVLYQKNATEELFKKIARRLDSENINYYLVRYGSFKQTSYFSLLEKAKGMIYLPTSESQGLAIQEAWIRDVPTLVWDRGYWEKGAVKFEAKKISCPLLTDETGVTFHGENDFAEKLEHFMAQIPHFKARNYSLKNLTDKVTTQKFLAIIREL